MTYSEQGELGTILGEHQKIQWDAFLPSQVDQALSTQ